MTLRSDTRGTARRAFLGIMRGTLEQTDVTKKLQELTVSLFKGEKKQSVENWGQFTGYASRPAAPTKDANGREQKAEVLVGFLGGNGSHPVVLGVVDRRNKPPVELAEGESVYYCPKGSYTHYKADGSRVDRGSGGSTVVHDKDGNITMTPASGGKLMMG